MIVFFIVAGLMIVSALLFIVPPLIGKRLRQGNVSHGETNLSIYRDQLTELAADLMSGTLSQNQYDAAKREIERRVLEEAEEDAEQVAKSGGPNWTLAISAAVMIPFVAISTYLVLGNPVAFDPSKVAAQNQGGHEMTPERIAIMVSQVKERLISNPDDAEGWYMMAKSTQAIGRYDESVAAYRELMKLVPLDAQLLADFADTLAVANGRKLEGEPLLLIDQALKVDPNNVKALALGGTAAFNQQNFARAAELWKKLLAGLPPDAEFAQQIQRSIAEAESRGGLPKGAGVKLSSVVSGPSISGNVTFASGAAGVIGLQDTVFVFARAATGPKMPLAIQRITARDLPFKFMLTESMAMAPGMSISKFPDLLVGARVSKSGNAIAQPGDWESDLVSVKLGASGVQLVISKPVNLPVTLEGKGLP